MMVGVNIFVFRFEIEGIILELIQKKTITQLSCQPHTVGSCNKSSTSHHHILKFTPFPYFRKENILLSNFIEKRKEMFL